MEEAFNSYLEWLGIQGGRRPGNHYELLGIELFESDPSVIAQAADRLTARIRSIRPGLHLAEWQRLLDALAGAKTCLLDPHVKAAYDASLRGQPPSQRHQKASASPPQGSAPSMVPIPVPPNDTTKTAQRPLTQPGSYPTNWARSAAGPAPPVQTRAPSAPTRYSEVPPPFPRDSAAAALDPRSVRSRRFRGTKPSNAQIAVYVLTVVLFAVAAVFAYQLYQQRSSEAGGDQAISQTRSPAAPAVPGVSTDPSVQQSPSHPDKAATSGNQTSPRPEQRPRPKQQATTGVDARPQRAPKPRGQQTLISGAERQSGQKTQPEQRPTPESAADRQRQEGLRQLLGDVRFAMSEHNLAEARRHLEAAAQQAKMPQELAEIDRLDTLLGHLEEFWKGMSRIVAGLESAEALPVGDTVVAVVEASPDELTIKAEGRLRTYKIDRMPSRLVQALANARFADDPATKVLIGSYLLVDAEGDPARTRQLWAEAARQGIKINGLLPELDHWAGASRAGGPGNTGKAAPPTDQQKLQQAERSVRERFQAEFAQATSMDGKSRLANTLLEAGRATTDDSELRFVLLREARDLAVAAGEAGPACQAIDQIAGLYEVDALAMKAAALAEASKIARRSNAQSTIAQTALSLVAQAIEARRLDEATRLAETALSAARKSSSRSLMQEAVLLVQQVEALQKEREGLKQRAEGNE